MAVFQGLRGSSAVETADIKVSLASRERFLLESTRGSGPPVNHVPEFPCALP
jgi:hypothetical protein